MVPVGSFGDGPPSSFSEAVAAGPVVPAGGVLRVNVPEAAGGKVVLGQLTVDGVSAPGYVTAYGCDVGAPRDASGKLTKSDLNYGFGIPVASNRLVVDADNDGDVCFFTLADAAIIVDVSGVSSSGLTAIPNQRTDTRSSSSQ